MGAQAPVEYAVAVEEYLGRAALGDASRRVYRISLTGWAWPLVGKQIPARAERRGAAPPVVPLALLDDPGMPGLLAEALANRAAATDARTVNRELSALRSAVGWWHDLGWIRCDPTFGLRQLQPGSLAAPLRAEQVNALFLLPASLREHAFWRVLYDTGAPAVRVLALDAGRLDLQRHQARPVPGGGEGLRWREATSEVLRWLLAGRTWGPVFLTGRRAPARGAAADACRVTGQGRMSYRRAAEIFTAATRPLDPAGHGWTLHQLSAARSGRLHRDRNPRRNHPHRGGCHVSIGVRVGSSVANTAISDHNQEADGNYGIKCPICHARFAGSGGAVPLLTHDRRPAGRGCYLHEMRVRASSKMPHRIGSAGVCARPAARAGRPRCPRCHSGTAPSR